MGASTAGNVRGIRGIWSDRVVEQGSGSEDRCFTRHATLPECGRAVPLANSFMPRVMRTAIEQLEGSVAHSIGG
eukprot:3303304-Rhodomonas_salina.1